ncbi:hypothetical protein ANO11243_096210 [Dothideomycetidae sp. 11243]|nr:hypothetical protein ANO11243_096210 [fungal sp. No.11243]
MASEHSLPTHHRALLLNSTRSPLDLSICERPTPQATSGSAVVRILAAPVISYAKAVFAGEKPAYHYPDQFVPGFSAIGRVVAVGNDATLVQPGKLVFVDPFIRARDDPSAQLIAGVYEGFTDGSRKLMAGEWRDSTYAEYTKAPLESCYVLDEERLLGKNGLGYELEDLAYIAGLLVPFGGLRDVDFKPGESLIVGPATGPFGNCAVHLGLALGASRLTAMGRNKTVLAELERRGNGRVKTVPITGDSAAETKELRANGPVDVFFDISPPFAIGSSHFKAGIEALGYRGRASLMGGQLQDIPIPIRHVMHHCIQLRGKWMYESDDVRALIKLIEAGIVKLGAPGGIGPAKKYSLDDHLAAFDTAAENAKPFSLTVICP